MSAVQFLRTWNRHKIKSGWACHAPDNLLITWHCLYTHTWVHDLYWDRQTLSLQAHMSAWLVLGQTDIVFASTHECMFVEGPTSPEQVQVTASWSFRLVSIYIWITTKDSSMESLSTWRMAAHASPTPVDSPLHVRNCNPCKTYWSLSQAIS